MHDLALAGLIKQLAMHRESMYFMEPVDAEKFGLLDYHEKITNPMDLGTIRGKLDRSEYATADAFVSDVRLTFDNHLELTALNGSRCHASSLTGLMTPLSTLP